MADQDTLRRFRAAADQARFYEDQTDTNLWNEETGYMDPRFKHFAETGQYRPSSQAFPDEEIHGANFGQGRAAQTANQSPTQQWNAQAAPNTGRDQFYALLMQRAGQGLNVNRDDPTLRAQIDPGVAQLERAKRNYLGDVAEKAGPYGNIAGETRMANERFGQQAGLLESEVLGREVSARRDEIAQALQLWGATMSTEQQMALQRELAMLNDRARSADRNQSNDQFLRELALREFTVNNDWLRWEY